MSTVMPRSTRARLLVTIGIVYAVALIGIGVYAFRSASQIPARSALGGDRICGTYEQPPASHPIWDDIPSAGGWTAEARAGYWQRLGTRTAKRWELTAETDLPCSDISGSALRIPARAAQTLYERETITTALIASTLATIMLAGAALIWTKPENSGPAQQQAQRANGSAAPPPGDLRTSEQNASDVAGDSSTPPAVADQSKVAESLRQLKALHTEGILTDDEYETKRKALTDRL